MGWPRGELRRGRRRAALRSGLLGRLLLGRQLLGRQLLARLPQIAPGSAAAPRTTPDTGEQQAQAEHPDRPDPHPVEEKFACGDGEVIVEYPEVAGRGTNTARIGRHCGNADNSRADENDEPDGNDHDNSVALIGITFRLCPVISKSNPEGAAFAPRLFGYLPNRRTAAYREVVLTTPSI